MKKILVCLLALLVGVCASAQTKPIKKPQGQALKRNIAAALPKIEEYEIGSLGCHNKTKMWEKGCQKDYYAVVWGKNQYAYEYKIPGKTVTLRGRDLRSKNPHLTEKDFQDQFYKIMEKLRRINEKYAHVLIDLLLDNYGLMDISDIMLSSSEEHLTDVFFKDRIGHKHFVSQLNLTLYVVSKEKGAQRRVAELRIPEPKDRDVISVVGAAGAVIAPICIFAAPYTYGTSLVGTGILWVVGFANEAQYLTLKHFAPYYGATLK